MVACTLPVFLELVWLDTIFSRSIIKTFASEFTVKKYPIDTPKMPPPIITISNFLVCTVHSINKYII